MATLSVVMATLSFSPPLGIFVLECYEKAEKDLKDGKKLKTQKINKYSIHVVESKTNSIQQCIVQI